MTEKEASHGEGNRKEEKRMENKGKREENGRGKGEKDKKVAARQRQEQTGYMQNGDGYRKNTAKRLLDKKTASNNCREYKESWEKRINSIQSVTWDQNGNNGTNHKKATHLLNNQSY